MVFSDLNLNNPLLNALEDMGINHPTPIQVEAFPVVMSGKDVVGVAQTGTGKTFAYVLPILRNLKFSRQNEPRVLILVPTRELVAQVVEEIEKLTTYMSIRVGGVYGGVNIRTQQHVVIDGLDILVGTPGRVMDLAMGRALKLKSIRQLVLDEADEMLNLGFRTQLNNLFDMLPSRRQNLLFSATMNEEVLKIMADEFIEPVHIEIAKSGTPLEQIEQKAYDVPNFHTKINLVDYLLENHPEMDRVLVFAPTKKLADLVHERLGKKYGDLIGAIHSNKSQNYRFRSVENFANGTSRVLIATDLIARGLDIREVSHVVNMDMPEEAANYIHRIGRTGRADQTGIAISMVTEKEEPLKEAIEDMMGVGILTEPLPEAVAVSEEKIPDEIEVMKGSIEYFTPLDTSGGGAFHEKKAKNKKVNLGSPGRRRQPKNKKLQKRSGRRK